MEQYKNNLLFESDNYKYVETHKDIFKIYFNRSGEAGIFDNHIEHRLNDRSIDNMSITKFISKLKKFIDLIFSEKPQSPTSENDQNIIKAHNKLNKDKFIKCLCRFEKSWIKVPLIITQETHKGKTIVYIKVITILNKKAKDDNYRSDAVFKLAESAWVFDCEFIL
jgi:hypothetical protein